MNEFDAIDNKLALLDQRVGWAHDLVHAVGAGSHVGLFTGQLTGWTAESTTVLAVDDVTPPWDSGSVLRMTCQSSTWMTAYTPWTAISTSPVRPTRFTAEALLKSSVYGPTARLMATVTNENFTQFNTVWGSRINTDAGNWIQFTVSAPYPSWAASMTVAVGVWDTTVAAYTIVDDVVLHLHP